jgi:hypothetical protein
MFLSFYDFAFHREVRNLYLAAGRYVTSESFFFFVGRYERDEKTDDRYIPISLILFAMSHSSNYCERSIIGRTPAEGVQTQVQRLFWPPL